MGDVVLTEEDVVSKRDFPDGCVPSTWSIDLHYPKQQYAKKFPENPFISIAVHGKGSIEVTGIRAHRCFYSRNVNNLFMAGKMYQCYPSGTWDDPCHEDLWHDGRSGRQSRSICTPQSMLPRDVYEEHLDELLDLVQLPGKARRSTPSGEIVIPADALPGRTDGATHRQTCERAGRNRSR